MARRGLPTEPEWLARYAEDVGLPSVAPCADGSLRVTFEREQNTIDHREQPKLGKVNRLHLATTVELVLRAAIKGGKGRA